MKPAARPVHLDLLRIHLPLSGWVSILHRVSGALLVLALPLAVYALAVSLSDEAGYARAAEWFGSTPMKFFLLALFWALAHHFFAGLRHLALDLHRGLQRDSARRTSVGVLVAAGVLTLVAAWRLFG